jgi:SAM-dependent methyltransferase
VEKKDFDLEDIGSGTATDDSGPLDLSEAELAERRRRRKRAGLRVPSDDVPRPSAGAARPPTPIADEPDVDVDVDIVEDVDAATGDNGSAPARAPSGESEELGDDDLVEERSDPSPMRPVTFVGRPPAGPSAEAAHPSSGDVERVAERSGAAVVASDPASVSPRAQSPAPSGASIASAQSPRPSPGARAPHGASQQAGEDAEELSPSELVEEDAAQSAAPAAPAPAQGTPAARARPVPAKPAASASPQAVRSAPPAPPRQTAGAPSTAHAAAAAAASAGQGRPTERLGKPWFEEIFDEDYLRTLPFLTPHATQREAVFIAEALGIQPGMHLLDVGCGYGRHAMELAARGYQIVALDVSLPLLLRGADEAQRRGLTINFVHGDMRELNFAAQFDGAYCVFSTFGYFDDETNKRVAQNVARALKPGARLIVEVLNRDYVIADLPSRVWWEGDGCVVLEEVDFNYFTSRVTSNRSVVFEDGRQLEQEISIRTYSLHELGKLLTQCGFRVTEISGSLATRGHFFGKESRQLIVVAERRASESTGASPDDGLPHLRAP